MQIHEAETNKCKKKLIFESNEFEQGIEFALANRCDGLQIRNTFGATMDFRLFEKVANQIVFLSITGIRKYSHEQNQHFKSTVCVITFLIQSPPVQITKPSLPFPSRTPSEGG